MRITRWETNGKAEVVGVYDLDTSPRTVVARTFPHPLTSGEIAFLLNKAFENGRQSKADEIEEALLNVTPSM